jgi:hypothetical protein
MIKTQPIEYGQRLFVKGDADAPSFAKTWRATLERDVAPITMATVERLRFGDDVPLDESFDFAAAVLQSQFLDANAHHLAHAKNKEHFDFLANSLRENQARRDALEQSGIVSNIAAEFLNPINLLFAFPAVGASVRAATGYARIAQAGAIGAKQGLYAGLATEAIRYPFDQLETKEEAFANIAGSAAFGGVLGAAVPAVAKIALGRIPALRSKLGPEFDRVEKQLEEFERKGVDLADIKIEEVTDGVGLSVSRREFQPEKVDPETGEIISAVEESVVVRVNQKRIDKEFELEAYTSPETSGGSGLPSRSFEDAVDYKNFLFNKAKVIAEREPIEETLAAYKSQLERNGTKGKQAEKLIKQKRIELEDEVNAFALSDTAQGFGLKETAFTKYHLFGSPAFNVLRDSETPEGIKRLIASMTGNNQIALKRNTAGFGTNGLDQQMGQFNAKFRKFALDVEDLWVQSTKGRKAFRLKPINFSGEDALFVKNDKLEWFANELDIYLEVRAGANIVLTETQQKLHRKIKDYFKDFLLMAQDEGMLLGKRNYEIEINKLQKRRQELNTQIKSILDEQERLKEITPESEARVKEQLDEIELELQSIIDDLTELEDWAKSARTIEEYNIPRFYDVARLTSGERAVRAGRDTADARFYQEFIDVLVEEFEQNPIRYKRDKDGNLKAYDADPLEDARSVIANIIEQGHEPAFFHGSPRTKHLKARSLNMPDNKIKKFLVKDLTIFGKYAEAQGFNIAWARNFGTKKLQDILDDIEKIGKREGLNPKKIAKAKQAFYGDYLRVTGGGAGSPHRWDNQIARVLSSVSAYTRLPASGITAFGDLANTIAARPFKGMVFDLATEFKNLQKVIEDVDAFAEVLSMNPNLIREQLMADAKTGVQPSLADKLTHYPDKLWFQTPILGNDLLPITSATRHLAAAYNTSDITKLIVKIGEGKKVTAAQKQQLGTLGLNPRTIANIYKEMSRVLPDGKTVFQKSDSGRIFFANSRQWDITTKSGRDALAAFSEAIDIATDAQIIMAKSFDKPRIVDGLTFIPYHPIMGVFSGNRMKPDPNASFDGIQYTKIQTGIFKFPVQFMNYTFGATNSVVGRAFDPIHERTMQHMAASFATGLALLYIQKPDWWFENKSAMDIAVRAVDRAGMTGIYGDLLFEGIHTATAAGVDPESLPIRGKYRPTTGERFDPLLGPAPTQIRDLATAARDYMNNDSTAHARALNRNLPYLHILGLDVNFKLLHDITHE